MITGMAPFYAWLLRASWQAGLLALIILAVQWALQKKLSAAWRHALWFLVVLRLLLPVSPRSAVSLFNYTRLEVVAPEVGPAIPNVAGERPFLPSQRAEPAPNPVSALPFTPNGLPAAVVQIHHPAPPPTAASPSPTAPSRTVPGFKLKTVRNLAAWVWLVGVICLALRILLQNVAFARRLRGRQGIQGAAVLVLFERCKASFGICFPIELAETSAVASPALYGWWRPCLLLPAQMLPRFSHEELRYVFLHELAHVKRRDMGIHWLATGLKVLHWFNPVLWLAFRRMAADRELACDELALGHAAEGERRPYGETIIKLLETCARPAALPGLMGLLEDKDQMTRRITMIAKFRKHPRWSLLAMMVVLGLGFITLTDAMQRTNPTSTGSAKAPTTASTSPASDSSSPTASEPKFIVAAGSNGATLSYQWFQDSAQPSRPDLVGRIKAKAGGALAKATVFISTAGPKTGTSTFCPSCYLDCRKSAKSDEQGNFKIESLDPQLIFRILIVANSYKPKFVAKVDPAKGSVTVDLDPIEAGEVTPDRSVRGKVVDPDGKPIFGAVVEAHGIRKKNDLGTMWGTLPGVDPLAVTDEQGLFLLTAREPFEALDLRVEARAFARRNFTRVASGPSVHPLTLTEGASVSGHVVWNGKLLPGVSIGLVSADRGMENYTGNFDVGTDEKGQFRFFNLPPDVNYLIYGMIDSLKSYGAITASPIHAAGDGTTVEAGPLVVEAGHRLAGQVVLADGKPVPASTRLLVSRQRAWDSMQVVLDKEGRFDTTGIPKEALSLSARVTGYHVSPRNGSFDRMNPFQLVGRVERDVTNLVFLLEKGGDVSPQFDSNLPESAWPQNRPLRGSEGTAEHSEQWAVAGQMRDRETKQPLSMFRVTPGNIQSTFSRSFWDQHNVTYGTNGNFLVYLDRKFGQPALKVEADGYLPSRFTLLPESRTNLEFTLVKGAGPSGTVLLPDGQPAAGVSIALLCAGEQEVRLAGDGRLRSFRNKNLLHLTDPDGTFSIPPELDMEKVAVAAKEGFKMATVKELADNPRLVLEPWGRLKGVLYRASAPGTNEILDLAFQGESHFFLEIHTDTHDEGRFEFDQVPPGLLQINGRNMMGNNSWQNEPLQKLTLKPGQTAEIIIEAPARSGANRPAGSPGVASLAYQGRKDRTNFPNARPATIAPKVAKPVTNPGPSPEGVVLLPDGKPAADAEVALLVTGKFLSLGRGALRAYESRQEGLVAHSDLDGHFSLPSVDGATGVVVVHEQGYAQVTLESLRQSPQIKMQTWGRIEGVLHIGRRLGTNELVTLEQAFSGQGEPIFDSNDFQARTDDQGRFIITFVPPGERKLARMIPQGEGSWVHAPALVVDVKPGAVTRVAMGGSGRSVFGKVRLTESKPEVDWSRSNGSLHTPFPKSFPKRTIQKDYAAWAQSTEGKAFLKTNRSYPIRVNSDGSFRVEEIPPGKYELGIQFTSTARPQSMADYIGLFTTEVVIPEPLNQDDDPPADLGTLAGPLQPMPMIEANKK